LVGTHVIIDILVSGEDMEINSLVLISS